MKTIQNQFQLPGDDDLLDWLSDNGFNHEPLPLLKSALSNKRVSLLENTIIELLDKK